MSLPDPLSPVLSDQQVDLIASRLAERIAAGSNGAAGIGAARTAPCAPTRTELGEGVFATVDDAVDAAAAAFREFDGMTLEGRHRIIAAIRESMFEHARQLADHAHRETGLGRPD